MTDQITAEIPVTASSRPRHVAIIMDGNNRWAKARRLKGVAGHKAGVDAVKAVVETCARQGVEVLTLFAFSSENWRRPKDEVSALMRLFVIALEREVRKLHRNNIRLRIIGDRTAFNPLLQEHMEKAEALTRDNTAMTLVIAANYGGHWDITQATQAVAEKVRAGELAPSDITDDLIQQNMSIGDLPMPDLMIRTAGEQRISNFLLWHLAYTEFYFSDVFWPDFKAEEMLKALEAYGQRKRRFGQTDDQLESQASKQ
ncbi:MAG: di-trans,poly-cis-decaprenylcistransferase [Gammaproteobacteria bacterium]|uniref:Ditrans,polycis-undecaprenyl-diphosphate synthase ((2E,6E)-farnesyl-diphosphate specific) n=1 Tax=Marinobacter litoralis TaxID=187981 RepID=A0A3M2RG02_9GAMM|nr:polyprenyl diphosphate synthase [Marinobacter litoralis]MBR9870616.1 di-trans,poly-cis-decaprenylcistransferase [Gammaproteobacteria bacterium]RMJ03875.1 Ditrans,polycis-undecaprenyl-diphosphate synthase ((2E,6E)-farnesyl-diphosphate specific) [Marinobacter litoralis]